MFEWNMKEGEVRLTLVSFFFEMSVTTYQSVQHNGAEYLNLHQHCHEGIKSCSILILLWNKIVALL
jgi:hypothetical protein